MSASFSQADDATSILTLRELQVLREMGAGLSNTQIATKLGILENTVKDYAKALMAKLGVHNRTEVAVKGFETGLI